MIVSFYSYKGGVGRTQLCANVANYLCFQKNKKVLIWDWDFEAPGLHYFFNKKEQSSNSDGTLELFEDYVKTINTLKIVQKENDILNDYSFKPIQKSAEDSAEENITKISPQALRYPTKSDMVSMSGSWEMPEMGLIDLMPAGNYSNDFSYRSGNFDWMDFYKTMDGAAYVELLKEEIKKLNYDYILIDSRTGISDYSGICNIQLPDVNVMVVAATMQNFDGCETIINKIKNSQYLRINGKEAKILPVLSRVDTSGEKFPVWVNRFNEYFSKAISNLDSVLDPEFVDIIFRDIYFRDTFLPYTLAISAGENLFTHDTKQSDAEYKAPFINIAKLIEDLNPNKMFTDTLGKTIQQTGNINFYEKVSEENWKKYAVDAENNGNGRLAAIAFNQIGIKEPDPIKKLAYFQKSIDNDPSYMKAKENIELYYTTSATIVESQTKNIIENSSSPNLVQELDDFYPHAQATNKSFFINKVWMFLIGILVLSAILYLVYNTGKNQQIAIQAQQDSILDTSVYKGPLSNASVYFDSIRNLGKPVGIDISNKETIFDQTKVIKYGISFMFIKATEGQNFVDPSFEANWAIFRNKKFITGAYHYFSLKTDPILQADNFIKNVVIRNGDFPPILVLFAINDKNPKIDTSIISKVNSYLDRVNIYYGIKPIIFVSEKVASQLFGADPSKYYMWIGQPNSKLYQPNTKMQWNFWQFSTEENFEGILSNAKGKDYKTVDANQYNGTLDEMKAITFKPGSGTAALREAFQLLDGRWTLFNTEAGGKMIVNRDTMLAKDFNYLKFNWSTELINRTFKNLNNKNLYGKSLTELLNYFKKNKLISQSSKSVIHIGDVVFLDFKEKKGIQAGGIVYNMDAQYIYCLEGSDKNGNMKIRKQFRHRGDVFLAVTLKD